MSDGKLIIETELGTKSFDAQYNELERKLKVQQKRLAKLLSPDLSGTKSISISPKKISETQAKIEMLSNKMLDLRLKVKNAGDETDEMSQKTGFNFKKMGNTVKRYALSLIGLRTTYALVSRASSAYLSQDTELAEKLKSVWVGLGSFLAPALEFISNSLLKALGYLNVFIKALTGIDFLARANAKALKAQAGAQKELNNQTYDFDVIRKQQDNSSSGGGGGISGGDLFQIPELDEKVVKKLQDLAKWLKENEKLVKALGTALLIAFGASTIGKLIKNIGGLNGELGLLASIGIIAIGVELLYTALTGRELISDLKTIIEGFKELESQTKKNAEAEKGHSERLSETNKRILDLIENEKMSDEQKQIATQHLKNQTDAIENQIKNIEQQLIKTKDMKNQEEELSKELEDNIAVYEALYQQNLLNNEETEDYMNAIANLIGVNVELGKDTTDLKKKYYDLAKQTSENKGETYNFVKAQQELGDKLRDMTRKPWNIIIDTTADTVTGKLGILSSKLRDLTNQHYQLAIDAVGNVMNNSGLRHYAVGGIVTQPTRALIGEAGYPEAVVPMTQDYLSTLAGEIARYGNGGGNQPINIYFDGRLIQRQTASRTNQRNFITNT